MARRRRERKKTGREKWRAKLWGNPKLFRRADAVGCFKKPKAKQARCVAREWGNMLMRRRKVRRRKRH